MGTKTDEDLDNSTDADEVIDDPKADEGADADDDGSADTPAEAAARLKATKQVADGDADADPAGEDDADATADDKRARTIPRNRFDEVNEDRKALREQNEQLMETVRALSAGKPAAEAKQDDAPAFDIKAARKERLAALASGDDDKALELDEKIESLLLEKATENAAKRIRAENERDRQEAENSALQQSATEAKTKYPALDDKGKDADEDAIAYVRGKRDALMVKGHSASKALEQAVQTASKLFGWDKEADDAKDDGKKKAAEDRHVAGRTRNADAANRQPPMLEGRGERGSQTARKDISEMTEAEFRALPQAELDRLGGNA